jgi:hypothetical protein
VVAIAATGNEVIYQGGSASVICPRRIR